MTEEEQQDHTAFCVLPNAKTAGASALQEDKHPKGSLVGESHPKWRGISRIWGW